MVKPCLPQCPIHMCVHCPVSMSLTLIADLQRLQSRKKPHPDWGGLVHPDQSSGYTFSPQSRSKPLQIVRISHIFLSRRCNSAMSEGFALLLFHFDCSLASRYSRYQSPPLLASISVNSLKLKAINDHQYKKWSKLKGTIVFGTNGPQAVMREPGDQPAIQSWPETALLLDFIRYDRGACALFINLLAFTVGAL